SICSSLPDLLPSLPPSFLLSLSPPKSILSLFSSSFCSSLPDHFPHLSPSLLLFCHTNVMYNCVSLQVQASLKNLAERRTDIFGVEETLIGQKIGEGRTRSAKPTVQWDGHASSADIVKHAAQSHITAAQVEAHQKSRGLIPDPEKDKIGPAVPAGISAVPTPHLPLPTPPRPPPPGSRPPPQIQSPPVRQSPPTHTRPHLHPSQHMPQARPLFSSPPSMPGQLGNRPPPHQMGFQPGPGRPPMQHGAPPRGPGPGPRPLLQPPPGGLQPFPPINIAPDISPDMAPPMAKKVRSEADDLIPEQHFIAEHPGPVTFRVHVPNLPERSEWKMNGQLITMTLPITDPVSVIKAKISTEFGMPSGKQKLQIGTIFIKDSNSLGFYNISGSSVVLLGLKERGGRKR
ncbi:Splicing factor 3A subunit 1, partial [Geodia barretti]